MKSLENTQWRHVTITPRPMALDEHDGTRKVHLGLNSFSPLARPRMRTTPNKGAMPCTHWCQTYVGPYIDLPPVPLFLVTSPDCISEQGLQFHSRGHMAALALNQGPLFHINRKNFHWQPGRDCNYVARFLRSSAQPPTNAQHTWQTKPGMTRWKSSPLYPNPCSPVHIARKFSAVSGTTSDRSCATLRKGKAQSLLTLAYK